MMLVVKLWNFLERLKQLELLLLRRPLYSKLLHPRSQGAGVDAEEIRSTLLAVHNPTGFVQSPQNVIALRILERIYCGFLHRLTGAHHRFIDLNNGNGGEHRGALDDVLQFTHVSRPVVTQQAIHRLLRYAAQLFAQFLTKFAEKEIYQKRNIIFALAKRRHL